MLSKISIISGCAAALIAVAPAAPVWAQGGPLNARTEFTFNQPVELPGTTLPPGTYIFRFVDETSGRKVMQVTARDASNKTYGMFLTISAERPTPSDEAELRFLETPAGQPAAVKTWWYPGNTIGREFIYPKEQARRLAQATNSPVLTTKSGNVSNDQMKTADLAYVTPSGQETELSDEQLVEAAANTAPVGAVTQETATAGSAENSRAATSGTMSTTSGQRAAQSENAGVQSEGAMTRTALPRTSTPLAGIGILGLLSLMGAAALRIRL